LIDTKNFALRSSLSSNREIKFSSRLSALSRIVFLSRSHSCETNRSSCFKTSARVSNKEFHINYDMNTKLLSFYKSEKTRQSLSWIFIKSFIFLMRAIYEKTVFCHAYFDLIYSSCLFKSMSSGISSIRIFRYCLYFLVSFPFRYGYLIVLYISLALHSLGKTLLSLLHSLLLC